MPFAVLTVHSPLGEVPPVAPGQTYVFTVPVSTRAGHVHWAGTQLLVIAQTPACPYDEISATGYNWICSTQHGASVWATLEQCISRGLLRLVPPPKDLN